MNLAEAKYAMYDQRGNKLDVVKTTSEIFKPQAYTDAEKKKAAEKKAIHTEIKRIASIDIPDITI